MSTLVIVESPHKAEKIQHYLGPGYTVAASVGHVRDLPARRTGVAPPDFTLEYEETEKGAGVLSRLRRLVQGADRVILATDPDREGEAIAWHLKEALHLSDSRVSRVTYQAITEAAVKAAFAKPRRIDMALVRAQEARRGLDRLVGYTLSSSVSDAIGTKASAGRVQTPTLRLVVERERAIRAFVPVDHFGAELAFIDINDPAAFTAEWDTRLHRAEESPYVLDGALAEAAAAVRAVTVAAVEEKRKVQNAPPPFTTAALLQAANRKLGFSSDQTMRIAQALYDTHSLITYHRTDSVNLEPETIAAIRGYAQAHGLPLPAEPNRHVTKTANAQEAHEAIRPTDVDNDAPSGISADERALYELIHTQAVACQLAPCVARATVAALVSTDHQNDTPFTFIAKGLVIVEPGFTALTGLSDDRPLPVLREGQSLIAESGRVLQKRTEPPPRYTEDTLLKELEKRGIGRPSTWASILANIRGRDYIGAKGKSIHPTLVGEALIDSVADTAFAGYDYTAALEEALDAVARGDAQYRDVMTVGYAEIEADRGRIRPALLSPENGGAPACPLCGKPMRERTSAKGPFWGCTGYPECRGTLPKEDTSKPGKSKGATTKKSSAGGSGKASRKKPCPDCGKPMVARKGANGAFWGCSGYPECRHTEPKK